jgi:tetratricopeptide (TPR) repeat protein
MMKYLFVFFLLSGCATFRGAEEVITLKTSPEGAKVAITHTDGKLVELGVTPIKIDLRSEDVKRARQDHLIHLTVMKSGFVSQKILIDTVSRKKIELDVLLVELSTWTNPDSEVSSQHAERLIGKIQQVNRLMAQRQLPEALEKIDSLITQYPKASVLFSMKGSLQLLLGQKQAAIASYQQSLAINKDNVEAKKILEKLQGGRP